MLRKSYELNEFSKKSVLSALNDFDILDMHLSVDGRNQGYYTFYFRRSGFVFCEKILFSGNIYDKNTDVSAFSKIAKERIEYRAGVIDHYLDNPLGLHKVNFSRAAKVLSRFIYLQYRWYEDNKIVPIFRRSVREEVIEENILDLLNGGVSAKQIINVYFTKFSIIEELIIEKLNQANIKRAVYE